MSSVRQTVQQHRLTHTQSASLVRNVFRAAFSSIAYIRNLFDAENFNKVKLEKVKYFKIGEKANGDALVFKQWLEEGVFDALSKKYLKVVRMELYRAQGESEGKKRAARKQKNENKDDGRTSKNLLESYAFRVSYEDGRPQVEFSAGDGSRTHEITKEDVRKGVGAIIGSLIDLTNTLQPLPPNRVLSIKLIFTDNTPLDYQPPLFSKCCEDVWFNDAPLQAKVGNICTPYHNLQVEVFARNTARNRNKKVLQVKEMKVEQANEQSEEQTHGAQGVDVSDGQTRNGQSLQATNDQEVGSCAEDIAGEKCSSKGSGEGQALSQAVIEGEGRRLNGGNAGGADVGLTQDSDFQEIGGRKRGGTKRTSQVEEAIVQRTGREKRMRRGN